MRRRPVLACGMVIAALLLAACGGEQGASAPDGAADRPLTGGEPERAAGAPGVAEEAAGGRVADRLGGSAPAEPGAGTPAQPLPPLPQPPPAPPGQRVIKEGTIALEVAEGRFDEAFVAVISATRTHGGTVVASTTTNTDDHGTSGSVTVRVPVERYEDLLAAVSSDIGEVRSRNISSQDVSTEYVDLQSRLRHLQAQERFYLGLLDRAQSVADAIAVQQQLDAIQSGIEQIKGRLQYLDERTAFSTLTVELFEPGAALPRPQPDGARPSLGDWWASGRDAFVNAIGVMLVAALFLVPLLVPAGVAVVLWRLWRRRAVAVAGAQQ
ncbi:MAG TPA: DUF4349 domain-containing protein [Egibacteraceae bacterium]|nr:DUF4349 domain-containing protein [Egibacteraceae bacterium]